MTAYFKRLLIAAELEKGIKLNTSNVKQLCSTDEIYAEKKYKDPFSYIPSHGLLNISLPNDWRFADAIIMPAFVAVPGLFCVTTLL